MKIDGRAKKANKSQAFETVLKMKRNKALDPGELDSLLLHFAPPQPKTPTTPLQWVASAIRKPNSKDKRTYLSYLRVHDGVLMATDGHRLHATYTELDDGCYDPTTLIKVDNVDGQYPDAAALRIINDARAAAPQKTISELTEKVFLTDPARTVLTLGGKRPMAVDEAQLLSALGPYTDTILQYNSDDPMRLYGEHEWGTFVLMSIHI